MEIDLEKCQYLELVNKTLANYYSLNTCPKCNTIFNKLSFHHLKACIGKIQSDTMKLVLDNYNMAYPVCIVKNCNNLAIDRWSSSPLGCKDHRGNKLSNLYYNHYIKPKNRDYYNNLISEGNLRKLEEDPTIIERAVASSNLTRQNRTEERKSELQHARDIRYSLPETRLRMSNSAKQMYVNDPNQKTIRGNTLRKMYVDNPELSTKISERIKNQYKEDDVFRKNASLTGSRNIRLHKMTIPPSNGDELFVYCIKLSNEVIKIGYTQHKDRIFDLKPISILLVVKLKWELAKYLENEILTITEPYYHEDLKNEFETANIDGKTELRDISCLDIVINMLEDYKNSDITESIRMSQYLDTGTLPEFNMYEDLANE